tara:strand:+ start:332 stop:487 length:156 start_codon:yes stop_codon:yes gene_type:complete
MSSVPRLGAVPSGGATVVVVAMEVDVFDGWSGWSSGTDEPETIVVVVVVDS